MLRLIMISTFIAMFPSYHKVSIMYSRNPTCFLCSSKTALVPVSFPLFGNSNIAHRRSFENINSIRVGRESDNSLTESSVSAILLSPVASGDSRRRSQAASLPTPSKLKNGDEDHSLHYLSTNRATLTTLPAEIFRDLEDTSLMHELIASIKSDLACLKDSEGEVSVSAYDTAWVARIADRNDVKKPQFPKSLDWIVANQHSDGSWGDKLKPWLFDRVVQTLSCLVTLKHWNFSSTCIRKGEQYLRMNAEKLQDEEILRMPIGFELFFPALLAEAKTLGLDIPFDNPFFLEIQSHREQKLKRIPLQILHSYPTTMLHTLEGLQDLDVDWQQILKFQSDDGSMCCSPSSTAALYMKTGDPKCLAFLERALLKFDDAVPTVYPLDTFHNLWVVDTLERLGISRHFETEIGQLLASIYRSWSDTQGICWAKVLKNVPDLDDTSMAFRLLRQHGYLVSAECFKGFQKEKTFVCFAVGQLVQGVSDMLNLFRASQVSYPNEKRLEAAENFSQDFLQNALANKKGNVDKWSLKTDLSGEIEFALKYPKYKSLERIDIRHYLDMYGPQDAWIGKSIYRLPLVNNSNYIKLAKLDFNMCQRKHRKELREILRWISDSGIADSSSIRERIVMLHAMFSAEIWEPKFSSLRIAAGKSMFIAMALYQLFIQPSSTADCLQLVEAIQRWDPSKVQRMPESFSSCFKVLFNTINEISTDVEGRNDIMSQLVSIWGKLVAAFLAEADCSTCSTQEEVEKYRKIACTSSGLEAIAFSSVLMSEETKNADFVTLMENDPTFLLAASDAVQLAQIIAARKYLGRVEMLSSMYTSYLEEEGRDAMTDSTKEDAHFVELKKQMHKKLNEHQKELSTVPHIVKRVLLSFTKVANFNYETNFEEHSHKELQKVLVDDVE